MISPDFVDRNGVAWWKENSVATKSKDVVLWTGLLDKLCKEIYEGDIVAYFDNMDPFEHTKAIGEIIWHKERCQLIPRGISKNVKGGYYICHWGACDDIEVIGNIYENPELLKGKDNGKNSK